MVGRGVLASPRATFWWDRAPSCLAVVGTVALADALPTACLQIWWLDPELTYGNAKPFVFTQGHSVCNRSFFPCFDTPAVKCTYSAVVKVSVPGLACLLASLREGALVWEGAA